MRTVLLSSLLSFLACASGIGQSQTGLIRGTLVDVNGNPVANADVFAMFYLHCDISDQTRARIESGEFDRCLSTWDGRVDANTDKAGIFELQGLQWGVYELSAQKPEEGHSAIFQKPMKIIISPLSPSSQVIFHLPPRSAHLRGVIKNTRTDELVESAALRIRRKSNHGYCDIIGTPALVDLLVPSEREFTLEVVAPGFETWFYRGTIDGAPSGDTPMTLLNLQAGETLNLSVALKPLPKSAGRGGSVGIDCPIDNDETARKTQ